jgi:hypothetical protein
MPWRLEKNPALASVLSGYIRQQQHHDRGAPVIQSYNIEALEPQSLKSPAEQRDALILWIGDHQPSPVDRARATQHEVAAIIGAFKSRRPGRSDAEDGLQWLLQQVKGEHLFVLEETSTEKQFELTMRGWELYRQLKRHTEESRTAFMAMKFNDTELDGIVREHFKPAVAAAGFDLRLLTDGQGAGLIDNQIRARIRAAAFMVADLTHDNDGAYFEAGFAEGLGLPVIYTCEAGKFKEKKTHFDTNHSVTVPWDRADLAGAANALKQTIRNTLPAKAKLTDE